MAGVAPVHDRYEIIKQRDAIAAAHNRNGRGDNPR
jgi:hypothetical protein